MQPAHPSGRTFLSKVPNNHEKSVINQRDLAIYYSSFCAILPLQCARTKVIITSSSVHAFPSALCHLSAHIGARIARIDSEGPSCQRVLAGFCADDNSFFTDKRDLPIAFVGLVAYNE